MDLDDQIELEHLLFFDRRCRSCNKVKNLVEDFYLTHKGRSSFASAYSYECKECTKIRILSSRKTKKKISTFEWEYPDW